MSDVHVMGWVAMGLIGLMLGLLAALVVEAIRDVWRPDE